MALQWQLGLRIQHQAIIIIASVFCFTFAVSAADYEFNTSASALFERNDNIFFSSENELADSIWTFMPLVSLVRNSERSRLRADGRLSFYHYHEYDALDNIDQWYNVEIDTVATERWSLDAQANYIDDNRPDRDVEETGLVLGNIRRRRLNIGASVFGIFTEKLSGGLYIGGNREDFDDPQVSDREDVYAIFSFHRSLESLIPRSIGRLNVGYGHYTFDRQLENSIEEGDLQISTITSDQTEVDNYSLTVGIESELSEKLDLLVDIGSRFAQSERQLRTSTSYEPPLFVEPPFSETVNSDDYGFVGTVKLDYRGERFRTDVLLSNDLQPVSGSNSMANRTTVKLGGAYRMTEGFRANAAIRWFRNENDQEDPTQQDINTQTWNFIVGLKWELTDGLDFLTDYTYALVDNRKANTTAYGNRFIVSLRAHHDWLE